MRDPSAPADLAAFRTVRALRTSQPGAYAALWNAHAGPLWSVVRCACASDAEAVGWMLSLRVDLADRVTTFEPHVGIGPQLGLALLQHVAGDLLLHCDGIVLPAPFAESPREAVNSLPRPARLLYATDVYFDVDPDDVGRVTHVAAGALLERARALIDPLDAAARDEHRGALAAALYRAPPPEALFLPPGATPPPRGRWIARAVAVAIVALAVGAAVLLPRGSAPRWESIAGAHTLVTTQPTWVQGDAEALARTLARARVEGPLVTAPDLSGVGLVLLGATSAAEGSRVSFVYTAEDGSAYSLHHLAVAPAANGRVVATSPVADGLEARAFGNGDLAGVSWAAHGTTWILVGDAPPDRLLARAVEIRKYWSARAFPAAAPSEPLPSE